VISIGIGIGVPFERRKGLISGISRSIVDEAPVGSNFKGKWASRQGVNLDLLWNNELCSARNNEKIEGAYNLLRCGCDPLYDRALAAGYQPATVPHDAEWVSTSST
jgi:hypothetical protein